MPPNTATIAQVGNLLTSPVFLTALATLLGGFAALWSSHFDPSSPAFIPSLVAMIGAVGTILTHWATAPVSITSTTLLPSGPVPMPAGTGVVTTGTAAVPGIAFTPLPPTTPGFAHTVEVPIEPLPSTAPGVVVRQQAPLPIPPAPVIPPQPPAPSPPPLAV